MTATSHQVAPEEVHPSVIDLFCGAGGLSLGLHRAGLRTALAVDNWMAAESTFRSNFPDSPFLRADASELSASDLRAYAGLSRAPDVIAGGPPCQGFSSAGRRSDDDARNTLVGACARLVADSRPEFVIFENVEGFLTMGRGAAIIALLDPLIEAGYLIHLRKVNAANYGVPQLRKRVIAVGWLRADPSFPDPTHSASGAPGVHRTGVGLPATPTLGQAIATSTDNASAPPDHVRRPLEGVDAERRRALQPGQTMRDLPADLRHKSFDQRARRRVRDGTPTARRGGAPAGLHRLRADEPSKAITGSASSEFLHPSIDGYLTLRECARLQTFPDDFLFLGSRRERALLIGNAVPPRLGEAIGEAIRSDFISAITATVQRGDGALCSFVPTAASGMSPALAAVVDIVQSRYKT